MSHSIKSFTFLLSLIPITNISLAQQSNKALRLGATIGTKYSDFDNTFGTTLEPEIYSFSLGAGASYLYNKIIIGAEFYHSNANRSNDSYYLQHNAFASNFMLGYALVKTKSIRLESSVGFGLSNNQIVTQNKPDSNSLHLYNNQFSVDPSVSFYNIGKTGLAWGGKVSYTVGTNGDTEWKFKSAEENSTSKGDINAFKIQFTTGGAIDFITKKKS
jgi:hypothetical protein